MPLLPGPYDQIVTRFLEDELSGIDPRLFDTDELDDAEVVERLAKHLGAIARRGLPLLRHDAANAHADAVNAMIAAFAERVVGQRGKSYAAELEGERLASGGLRLLKSVRQSVHDRVLDHPDTPLSIGALFTGTANDPTLESQLRKEIRSANSIDLVVSFLKWSGVRLVIDDLRAFASRDGARLRIITTCYIGATEPRAVVELASLPNSELRISYDARRTRLHAKAYLFHRVTEFGTAYVGSSNLSKNALTTGSEWNVKLSQQEQPWIWERLQGTFETMWSDPEYVLFRPDEESDHARLAASLERERSGGTSAVADLPLFDLRPFPFQQEILDRIEAERVVQGRTKHLVVAATGTGKTMIAAFDYKAFSRAHGSSGPRPRLLFVAHRREILEQSLRSFRAVLRDMNFGEMEGGGKWASGRDHLFITIQSWNSRDYASLPRNHFDYIIVDEFHHAAAPTYRELLEHVTPRSLLGLTATPERTDGFNVARYFDNHISAEVRLADAINRRLLSPFQYFGVTDPVSLRDLQWQRGGYAVKELEAKYVTGGDMRALMIADKFKATVADPLRARAIAFCVSVAHAEYMAERFSTFGIPAIAVTGETDEPTRAAVPERLRRNEVVVVCSVDLYNEGVDIPEVDTVLFLRPTESLTLFLQQLGRGLRLYEGKECLTVLDFVGEAHRKFRFDRRFGAMAGIAPARVKSALESEFPLLPAGCSIELEAVAREHVLQNIQDAARSGRREWYAEQMQELASEQGRQPTYAEFFAHIDVAPRELYRRKQSFASVASAAGLLTTATDPDEDRLTNRLTAVAHIDAPLRIKRTMELLSGAPITSAQDERMIAMLHFALWGRGQKGDGRQTAKRSIEDLRRNPRMFEEILNLLDHRLQDVDIVPHASSLPAEMPLELHASYTRDEILAAIGLWTFEAQREVREGVLYMDSIKTDVFFVTLDKSEREYSPSTMYQDYALGDDRFHWQSQSTTSEASPTGQRYIAPRDPGSHVLLFVRERKKVDGVTEPYSFLGPVQYESHTGSRPMSIVWKLDHPMPAKLVRRTARLAVG
jgi:superfamily II DNA or RNA helicase/HKD family nuclease